MIPLAGSRFPASHGELSDAITRGLAHYGITPREIAAEGGAYPVVESLRVDVTGARVTRDLRIASAGASGAERVQVGATDVLAHPLYFETAPVELTLHAEAATLASATSGTGDPMLMLLEARGGDVTLETKRRDLEVFVQSLVSSLASRQGVEVKSTKLHLESRGPRSLHFRAEVSAKMLIMSAKVIVDGELDVDNQLGARLSHLTCTGEGMVGTAATALVRPYLEKLESRVFPLMAFSLGNVKLRDVSIQANDTVRVHAAFSS